MDYSVKFAIKKFFNISGQHYRQQNLKDKVDQMTLDETCELLSQDGMLIKRPLAVNQDHVTIGFNEKCITIHGNKENGCFFV
ncbi:ArsC/Spx/MgsR family protein [Ligilactobacillus sp. LYQ135]